MGGGTMTEVRRIYVEKKPSFAVRAREVKEELRSFLNLTQVEDVRILIRYDVEGVSEPVFQEALTCVFAEPPLDTVYLEKLEIPEGVHVFSVEALPGQFDQRADSAIQCLRFLKEDEEPIVRTAVTYLLYGALSEEEVHAVESYIMNPVDSRIAKEQKPNTLKEVYEQPAEIALMQGFLQMDDRAFQELYESLNLAMTYQDFLWIRTYFRNEEHREPTVTEIRVLDTYWSDHCRHTTFSTVLKKVDFEDGFYLPPIKEAYHEYQSIREELYQGQEKQDSHPICLMDVALAGMKKLKADGLLTDQEDSEENNACSVVVPVDVDYGKGIIRENWLVFFKNETHNHPTEIEPFGGAATCLGGAIRDPLSGRGYVYQAMRVTGAADPTLPVAQTLEGKLPQKRLVKGAANGYSSYGNQIGLATGLVDEIYHPGYVAKRMEIGAVMGAARQKDVVRKKAEPEDVIILLGGRTGRDGIGGATGSSKKHTSASLTSCGAEVQKGNAPTERKIQRLFRRPEVSSLIKKCNDFGAGGVSVAIGELADGLTVNLDLVPKKYAGLDGTELAISESQERMAVVVSPKDEEAFLRYAAEENLEAVSVAKVTKEPRLVLLWHGKKIVDLSRAFLNTNGARQEEEVLVTLPDPKENYFHKIASEKVEEALQAGNSKKAFLETLSDLNVCSKKGLSEMFDASIGAGTVVMPFGGEKQLTPIQTMAAKLPILRGGSDVITMMSYGFDPYLSTWSPFHGASYAVLESVSKIVASGGDYKKLHLTFQEYFRRMRSVPSDWGEVLAALLGALHAQLAFGIASIGGKDSMSGSFNEIHVPPTLVSFAVDVAKSEAFLTPECKKAGNFLVEFRIPKDTYDLPDYPQVKQLYDAVTALMREGKILSCYAEDAYGIAASAAKMAFGSWVGVHFQDELEEKDLFVNATGNLLAEVEASALSSILQIEGARKVAELTTESDFVFGKSRVSMEEALASWTSKLEKVFPTTASVDAEEVKTKVFHTDKVYICKHKLAKPRVFIPVFPGTNCEYDSAAAFEEAGAITDIQIFRNRDATDIRESVSCFEKAIDQAQIIMFPGGFSAGDEPDGSAKFFATAFRNERMKLAVERLLHERDGLALGICNGFQAMIKLGLVPYGDIWGQKEDSVTLTNNTLGRHISHMAHLKVVSNLSPWLSLAEEGGVYVNPVSHGEGRFVGPAEGIQKLFERGQVATQYCMPDGRISMDDAYNLNGSYFAIEGITSPDGRCYGKMAHAERRGRGVACNITGNQNLRIFEAGVRYFAD